MWKSAELEIGWVRGSGPGGGAWPFWLSAGMALASILTIIRWIRRVTPESRSNDPFMSAKTQWIIGSTTGGLLLLLIGTHFIGIYISIIVFLLLFVRVFGRHSWITTGALMVGAPIVIFVFFEWALKIPLPKGVSEPLFYPIFDLIY
jgi:hypothetical protein